MMPPRPVPRESYITMRFNEAVAMEHVALVEVEIIDDDQERPHLAGSLMMLDHEWDRIWRALAQSAAAFEREKISLVRSHSRERF